MKLLSGAWWQRKYIDALRLASEFRWERYTSVLDDAAIDRFYRNMWRSAARDLPVEFADLHDGFLEARLGERVTRIHQHKVMLDDQVTYQLSRSKAAVHEILTSYGVPVPQFCQFDVYHLAPAVAFLRAVNGPCVVKPARGWSGGAGVTTNVVSVKDLKRAAIFASLSTTRLLIERQIAGDAYRLLYLDGECLDVLRRRSPMVIGDGRSTIRELLDAENTRRTQTRGATGNLLLTVTPDCRSTLRRAGLSLRSVPKAGVRVVVKTASNEASASDCESVRGSIGEALIRDGARAAAALGVRLAGVDAMTADPSVSLKESGGKIVEVNAVPGLHYHYQTRNPADRVAVAEPILRRLLGVDSAAVPALRPFRPVRVGRAV